MIKYITVLALGFTLLATACKSNKEVIEEVKATQSTTAQSDKGSTLYTLNTGPCFGRCPEYTFTLQDNGLALLDKQKHLPQPGKYEMKLDDATFMGLIRDLDKANIMDMKNEYESEIPDLPLTTMTYRKGDMMKMVKGKENLPQELRAIQDKVEMMIKSPGWKLIEAYEGGEEAPARELILTEIRVTPNSGVALSRWMRRYSEEGLRLMTRVDKEQNIWLFTWNTDKIAPRKFMARLKEDADLKHVEFNYTEEEAEEK